MTRWSCATASKRSSPSVATRSRAMPSRPLGQARPQRCMPGATLEKLDARRAEPCPAHRLEFADQCAPPLKRDESLVVGFAPPGLLTGDTASSQCALLAPCLEVRVLD